MQGALVGRSSFCLFPDSAKELPDMGVPLSPNIEEIIKLAPDIIISETEVFPSARTQLEATGIKFLLIPPAKTIADIPKNIDIFARLAYGEIDGAARAKPLIEAFAANLAAISLACEVAGEKTIAAYLIGDYYFVENDSYEADVFGILSLLNIASGEEITPETLEALGPDVLLVSSEINISALPEHPLLGEIPAVKEGRVYPINQALMDRRSFNILKELMIIAEAVRGESLSLERADLSFYKTPVLGWPQENETEEESKISGA